MLSRSLEIDSFTPGNCTLRTIASSSPTVAVCTWPIDAAAKAVGLKNESFVDQSAPSSAARTDCTCAAGIAIDLLSTWRSRASCSLASIWRTARIELIFCASLSVAPRIFVNSSTMTAMFSSVITASFCPSDERTTFVIFVAAALSAIFDAPAASAAARAAADCGTAFSVRFARLTSSARPKTTRSADVGSALRHVSNHTSSSVFDTSRKAASATFIVPASKAGSSGSATSSRFANAFEISPRRA